MEASETFLGFLEWNKVYPAQTKENFAAEMMLKSHGFPYQSPLHPALCTHPTVCPIPFIFSRAELEEFWTEDRIRMEKRQY